MESFFFCLEREEMTFPPIFRRSQRRVVAFKNFKENSLAEIEKGDDALVSFMM